MAHSTLQRQGRHRGRPHRREAPPRTLTIVGESAEFVGLVADIFDGQLTITPADGASIDAIAATHPQLLMVDLHAGGGDRLCGDEVVRLARRHPALGDVPIIVSTASARLDTGGDVPLELDDVHVLTKPFALETIEDLVARLLPADGG